MNRNKSIFLITTIIVSSFIGILYLGINFLSNQDNIQNPGNRVQFNLAGKMIDDFAYWLQDTDVQTIKNSKYDLIILDYSADGSEDTEYSSSEVLEMKSSEDQEKLLISYISIGEAENYRFYWDTDWDANVDGIPDSNAPEWLDIENPNWKGNYKVKFWIQGWQDIIFDYLDKIFSASFNGIYMDIIDAYEYYEGTNDNAESLMIGFLGKISSYVKTNMGNDFIIFAQNGDDLLQNPTYLEYIDGIGREDLFYDDDIVTTPQVRNSGIENLNKALDADKAVFIIDYPTSASNIQTFYDNCQERGYLGYATDRELNSLKEYPYYPST